MSSRAFIITGVCVAVFLGGVVSYWASSHPDGLEKAAEKLGFAQHAEGKQRVEGVLPDYSVPGVKSKFLSNAVAGIVGTLVVFGLLFGVGQLAARRQQRRMKDEG